MHEIVTIQLGQQANYVGTHYWNAQESYFTYSDNEESCIDHDVSFRPGIGPDGAETYTPRTLIYDLKGAFGSLRRENALYQLEHSLDLQGSSDWHAGTVPLRLPRIEPSSYQEALDQGSEPPALTTGTVRFWSDYNHVFYHPRSIVQLNDYELNSSMLPFEQWQKGEELFSNLDREHDLLDRDLRPFLEECDQLQGIQVFSSTDDAWGGFSSRYMERISDDLGKGCRWIFGFQDSQRTALERQRVQLANVAQSVYSLSTVASMHIPILNVPLQCPSYLSYTPTSRWHTSAMQAAALESSTLQTRLRRSISGYATFDHFETILGSDGKRPIASCTFSVSEPDEGQSGVANGHHDSRLANGYTDGDSDGTQHDSVPDIDLCPEFSPSQTRSGRQETRRVGRLFSKLQFQRGQAQDNTGDETSHTRDRRVDGPRVSKSHSTLLFPVLSSYPHIFRFDGRPQKLAVDCSLSTTSTISTRIRSLERITRRMIGLDEREALSNGLANIAEEYEEGWMSDEDSDDDH